MATVTRTGNKRNGFLDSIKIEEKNNVKRNCLICSHNKVCTIYQLFKQGITPQVPEDIIKGEDLALICKMYKEDDISGGINP